MLPLCALVMSGYKSFESVVGIYTQHGQELLTSCVMIEDCLRIPAYIASYNHPRGRPLDAPVTRYNLDDPIEIPDFFHIVDRAVAAVRVRSEEIEVARRWDTRTCDKFVVFFTELPPGNPIRYTLGDHPSFLWNGEFVVFRRSAREPRKLIHMRGRDTFLAKEAINL